MTEERRRYFRINETVGISYEILDSSPSSQSTSAQEKSKSVFELVSEQDLKIEKLLVEVEDTHPKVAELVSAFNQKLERLINHLMLESTLVDRLADRVYEANISACGIAFVCDEYIQENTMLQMELTLYPAEIVLHTQGLIVGCHSVEEGDEQDRYYLRIDFYAMKQDVQEELIQHIVKRQSEQLKSLRSNK